MAEEQPKKDDEPTAKGAVEVDENALDQLAGGAIADRSSPPLDYRESDFALKESTAQGNIVASGPGAGPHLTPEKKI